MPVALTPTHTEPTQAMLTWGPAAAANIATATAAVSAVVALLQTESAKAPASGLGVGVFGIEMGNDDCNDVIIALLASEN